MTHFRQGPPGDATAGDAGEWPEEASDPYCGELARQSRGARDRNPKPPATPAWSGEDRREDCVSCYDPYLVSLTRARRDED